MALGKNPSHLFQHRGILGIHSLCVWDPPHCHMALFPPVCLCVSNPPVLIRTPVIGPVAQLYLVGPHFNLIAAAKTLSRRRAHLQVPGVHSNICFWRPSSSHSVVVSACTGGLAGDSDSDFRKAYGRCREEVALSNCWVWVKGVRAPWVRSGPALPQSSACSPAPTATQEERFFSLCEHWSGEKKEQASIYFCCSINSYDKYRSKWNAGEAMPRRCCRHFCCLGQPVGAGVLSKLRKGRPWPLFSMYLWPSSQPGILFLVEWGRQRSTGEALCKLLPKLELALEGWEFENCCFPTPTVSSSRYCQWLQTEFHFLWSFGVLNLKIY